MTELAVLSTSLVDNIDLPSIQETMRKIRSFQALVKENLVESHDYGTIPGVGKPSLYKPGGEKICMLFGLNPEYEFLSITEDFKAEFFAYNIKCTLYRNGAPCAQGIGSCNSKEKKYRYTNVSEIPQGYIGASEQFTTSWGEVKYKIENTDVCSLVNTILKMAKKRAFVDAVLQVASLSEMFTQDIEDFKEFTSQEERAAVANMTPEQAAAIKLRFGKNKGKTLKEVYKADKSYLEWLLNSEKTDISIKRAIDVMFKAVTDKSSAKKPEQATSISEDADSSLYSEIPPDGWSDFTEQGDL